MAHDTRHIEKSQTKIQKPIMKLTGIINTKFSKYSDDKNRQQSHNFNSKTARLWKTRKEMYKKLPTSKLSLYNVSKQ